MQQVSKVYKCPLTPPHLLPYRVVTKETADLTKGHRSLSPRVLPAGQVLDVQTVQIALIQLSTVHGNKMKMNKGVLRTKDVVGNS